MAHRKTPDSGSEGEEEGSVNLSSRRGQKLRFDMTPDLAPISTLKSVISDRVG